MTLDCWQSFKQQGAVPHSQILRFGVGRGRKRRATPAAPPLLTRIDPAKPQVADLNPKQRHHRTPPNLPRTVIFCTLERLFRQDGLEGALRAARKRLRKLRGPPRATEEASSQHARTPPDALDEKSGRKLSRIADFQSNQSALDEENARLPLLQKSRPGKTRLARPIRARQLTKKRKKLRVCPRKYFPTGSEEEPQGGNEMILSAHKKQYHGHLSVPSGIMARNVDKRWGNLSTKEPFCSLKVSLLPRVHWQCNGSAADSATPWRKRQRPTARSADNRTWIIQSATKRALPRLQRVIAI